MYKVFFNDKYVLLTDKFEFDVVHHKVLFLRYQDFEELNYLIGLLEDSPLLEVVVLYSDNVEQLWADFRAHFSEIDAGGGVVTNSKGKILTIFRNGRWDLPKGKIEQNERVIEGAVREVKEECGIKEIRVGEKIVTSYHIYTQNGEKFLKRTFWYAMQTEETHFTPQQDEGIEEVKWEDPSRLLEKDSNVYASVKNVIETYLTRIKVNDAQL